MNTIAKFAAITATLSLALAAPAFAATNAPSTTVAITNPNPVSVPVSAPQASSNGYSATEFAPNYNGALTTGQVVAIWEAALDKAFPLPRGN